MENKSNKSQQNEQLRIENQIRRMKLELEHGANFGFRSTDFQNSVPPHIEKIFLDNIERFEKKLKESKPVKVYDFIGKPEIRKSQTLNDSEISHELERVKELLFQNSISFDTAYEVNERILYSFITEELFEKEIENIRIPGAFIYFIYEDFHPNHKYEVEDRCIEFITDFLCFNLDPYMESEVDEMQNATQLMNFRNSFSSFDVQDFTLETVSLNEDNAEAVFKIEFSATIEGTAQIENFSGFARFYLIESDQWWQITKCFLPGMSMS